MADEKGSLRVLADVIALQTQSSRHRGIGNYTHKVLCALLSQPAESQAHILLGNGHLTSPDPLPSAVPTPWRLYYGSFPLGEYSPESCPGQTGPYHDYWQAQVDRFAPQALHIHSPFEYEAPFHRPYPRTPTVVTVYDLIPLRFETQYLRPAPQWMRDYYRHVCEFIRQADHLITISEHSRNDIIELLGIEAQRISVATAGPIRPSSSPQTQKLCSECGAAMGCARVSCSARVDLIFVRTFPAHYKAMLG